MLSGMIGVENKSPDCIIMSECCLAAIAKNGESLVDEATLVELLDPWYGVADKYCNQILACLNKTSAWALDFDPPVAGMPSNSERKKYSSSS